MIKCNAIYVLSRQHVMYGCNFSSQIYTTVHLIPNIQFTDYSGIITDI